MFVPIFYILVKGALYFLVHKYGKFSYDGFSAAGFQYNAEKDMFYSTKNAWQKNFGYTHTYDVLAPLFRMIIDTEPIRFKYDNKNWLITFWKGQYGIVTGAEVGIYCTNEQKINKKTVYFPASDSEMLDMDITLYKKGELITRMKAKHWWLAIFKLGMFSKPRELTMDINITFPNQEMLEAFLESFKKLKHSKNEYEVVDKTFCFKYKKPHTRKVWTRMWLTDSIRQSFNKKNVKLYNKYLDEFIDDNKIDDSRINDNNLIILNELIPDLLKNIPEEENKSIEIAKKLFNEKQQNVIYLDNSVYSEMRVDKHV